MTKYVIEINVEGGSQIHYQCKNKEEFDSKMELLQNRFPDKDWKQRVERQNPTTVNDKKD